MHFAHNKLQKYACISHMLKLQWSIHQLFWHELFIFDGLLLKVGLDQKKAKLVGIKINISNQCALTALGTYVH